MNETTFAAWTVHHQRADALERELERRRQTSQRREAPATDRTVSPARWPRVRRLLDSLTTGRLRPAV